MYTNESAIDLPMAVWLAADDGYDLSADPQVISATALQKPLKALVLSRRAIAAGTIDIISLAPSRFGTAVHTAIEMAWKRNFVTALKNLGYPDHVIGRVRVNPVQLELDMLPVYLEQRSAKEINDFTISGKFDMVIDGQLYDIKTTSTYAWIKQTNVKKYALQGSIYRWLNPDIITEPTLKIQYLFTNWSPHQVGKEDGYPPSRIMTQDIPLLPVSEVERYIRGRLQELKRLESLPESELPTCTREELWQDRPVWAYYKNPENKKRATKLFNLETDAVTRWEADGRVGVIEKREATPTYCTYCEANTVCSQAEQFVLQGLLKL